ncbi:retron St85 family RNA-directed DNA polymerase [Halomonas elongata]|uniref:retron St85 family RNA-directed DNA polymerase n=1 Tax=Halomonas elongata TaxID=2746 RepID=UPI00336223CC
MRIEEVISRDLQVPESLINEAISGARVRVKKFTIPKKSGGYREIYHPSKKLKVIQYWLMHSVFCKMPLNDAAMAYREGISILHNAKAHSLNRYFLRMDFKDFFSSIRFSDIEPCLKIWHRNSNSEWDLNARTLDFINKSCFFKGDRLAVGYPSSPVISNIVMKDFDSQVLSEMGSGKYGDVVYTRYADDMVFSTNQRGACKEIVKSVEDVVGRCTSPVLKINKSKTRLGSSAGGSASVTGLKICRDGHITINRKLKDHIRLMLSLYAKGKLDSEEVPSLAGYLSYCHHVAPDFYSGLSSKFFKEIHQIRAMDF